MAKQSNNTFAGAAIALCMTEAELKRRLDAHIELETLKAERDRAIESAYFENVRLCDFAKAVIFATDTLETTGKLSKARIVSINKYAKNITTVKGELKEPAWFNKESETAPDEEPIPPTTTPPTEAEQK